MKQTYYKHFVSVELIDGPKFADYDIETLRGVNLYCFFVFLFFLNILFILKQNTKFWSSPCSS